MYEFSGTQTYLLCFHLVFLLLVVFTGVCVLYVFFLPLYLFVLFTFWLPEFYFFFFFWLFVFLLSSLDLPTLLTFFVTFCYCMSTVAFIFGAFCVPYKTIQTILLWELFVLQESLPLFFWPTWYYVFLISFYFAQLGLLWEPVQNSVKSRLGSNLDSFTYYLCGLGPVPLTLCFVFLIGKMKMPRDTYSKIVWKLNFLICKKYLEQCLVHIEYYISVNIDLWLLFFFKEQFKVIDYFFYSLLR